MLEIPTLELHYRENLQRLRDLVASLTYKPGWTVEIGDRTFGPPYIVARVKTIDSTDGSTTAIYHYVKWPDALLHYEWNDRKARYWLLKIIIGIETHEACEFFELDGYKPFFPPHGDGENPYTVRELPKEEWPRNPRHAVPSED